jgi:hypothetical protein
MVELAEPARELPGRALRDRDLATRCRGGWQHHQSRCGGRGGQARLEAHGHIDQVRRHGAAGRGRDHQEDHRAGGLREQELEVQVESEANQYIPFALDEVNLDFQVVGPAPSSPEEVEVLIAASRKEKVEDRVAVAEAAGLKPW